MCGTLSFIGICAAMIFPPQNRKFLFPTLSMNFITRVFFHRSHIILYVHFGSFLWGTQYPQANLEFSHHGQVRTSSLAWLIFLGLRECSQDLHRCLFSKAAAVLISEKNFWRIMFLSKGYLQMIWIWGNIHIILQMPVENPQCEQCNVCRENFKIVLVLSILG